MREIPLLIDFLSSYLQAGLILPNAISKAIDQKKWCKPIQTSLTLIYHKYSHGFRFTDCLDAATTYVGKKNSRQYLHILYLSLSLGNSTGENILKILEKVKQKTQDKLNLDRKIKITTAQMRLQAMIIILSPVFLSFIINLISPQYILFFINNNIGRGLLCLMVLLNLLGAIFVRRVLKIN